jgi:hypothetical protein
MTATKTPEDRLLAEISRRNWWLLAGLVLGSLLWRSSAVTLGVAGGGLLAIGGFHWLHRSLAGLLGGTGSSSRRGYQAFALLRLAALAGAIFLLLVPGRVHPLALGCGVSVVVLSLMWASLTRVLRGRIGDL